LLSLAQSWWHHFENWGSLLVVVMVVMVADN